MLIGVAAAGLLLLTALQAALHPWYLPIGGPRLVGTWTGELRTPTGTRWRVMLDMQPPRWECQRCPAYNADAVVCTDAGAVEEYVAWGHGTWRGDAFAMQTRPRHDDQRYALELGELDARWSGDTLEIVTTLRVPRDASTMQVEIDAQGRETVTRLNAHPDTVTPVRLRLSKRDGGPCRPR